ncbi:EscV/YscV/HrcV family type III secretion system export apparatus protein, partial [Candidatus Poribacteria bacterium]|nr:EscV/YscV/HrcV family type III secretion system export apparatus protein [Candidatus Poribacteria bacterium]
LAASCPCSFDPTLENALTSQLRDANGNPYLALDADDVQQVMEAIGRAIEQAAPLETEPILLAAAQLRPHLKRLTEPYLPNLVVLSYNEIPTGIEIRRLSTVEMNTAA